MRLSHALAASALLLTAILSGCTEKTTPPATSGPGETMVDMKGLQFQPKEITIKVGDKVTWTNKDAIGHDVKEKDGAWQSEGGKGGMANGVKWSKTFDAAGVVEYYCEAHGAGMSGKITVTA